MQRRVPWFLLGREERAKGPETPPYLVGGDAVNYLVCRGSTAPREFVIDDVPMAHQAVSEVMGSRSSVGSRPLEG